MGAVFGGMIFIIWLAFIALWVLALVFWIKSLVEVVKYPEAVWQWARVDKTTWLLIVILLGWIGALVYWFSQRQKLLAVQADLASRGLLYGPPPQAYAPPPQQYGYSQQYGYPQQQGYPPAPQQPTAAEPPPLDPPSPPD